MKEAQQAPKVFAELYNLWYYTKEFNEKSQNFRKELLTFLKGQHPFVEEEVRETSEALLKDDVVEVLDGCIDTLVTVFGELQRLEQAGVDVSGGMLNTGQNNLSKFCTKEVAENSIKWYKENKRETVRMELTGSPDEYVLLRESDGKIMKPLGFIRNDLSEFVPKALQDLKKDQVKL